MRLILRKNGANLETRTTMLFMRERLTAGFVNIQIFRSIIKRSNFIKYFGDTYSDNELNWETYNVTKTKKAIHTFW